MVKSCSSKQRRQQRYKDICRYCSNAPHCIEKCSNLLTMVIPIFVNISKVKPVNIHKKPLLTILEVLRQSQIEHSKLAAQIGLNPNWSEMKLAPKTQSRQLPSHHKFAWSWVSLKCGGKNIPFSWQCLEQQSGHWQVPSTALFQTLPENIFWGPPLAILLWNPIHLSPPNLFWSL